MAHPTGKGPSHEDMEVGSDGWRVPTEIIEALRREMQDLAIGIGDSRGGVRLVSIQADLAQYGPLEKGTKPNLLSTAPFEKNSHAPGHDEKDARRGLPLPH
jgi:hypothetical protein